MKTTALPMARGSTVQATLEFIRATFGPETLDAVLAQLDADDRRHLLAAGTTDHVPYERVLTLWRAADAAVSGTSPDWMEEAGAFAIASLGQQLYAGIIRKASPIEFVTQSVHLFRLYYSHGDIEAVEVRPGRTVVRLTGFDPLGPLFCRRQTGGWRCAIELAGGRDVRAKHVRCTFEGDAFCEWEIRWA